MGIVIIVHDLQPGKNPPNAFSAKSQINPTGGKEVIIISLPNLH